MECKVCTEFVWSTDSDAETHTETQRETERDREGRRKWDEADDLSFI